MTIIPTFSMSTTKGQMETEVLQAEEIFKAAMKAIVHLARVVPDKAPTILCGNALQDFANHAVLKDTMHGALYA